MTIGSLDAANLMCLGGGKETKKKKFVYTSPRREDYYNVYTVRVYGPPAKRR